MRKTFVNHGRKNKPDIPLVDVVVHPALAIPALEAVPDPADHVPAEDAPMSDASEDSDDEGFRYIHRARTQRTPTDTHVSKHASSYEDPFADDPEVDPIGRAKLSKLETLLTFLDWMSIHKVSWARRVLLILHAQTRPFEVF